MNAFEKARGISTIKDLVLGPLPDTRPDPRPHAEPDIWLLTYGHWGDAIISYGRALAEYGWGFGIAHYGHDPAIAAFLGRQWGCRKAIHIEANDADLPYPNLAGKLFNRLIAENREFWLRSIEERTGLTLRYCGLEIDRMLRTGPQRWSGARLSAEAHHWAANCADGLPDRFFVLNPYSGAGSSCPFELHWRYWPNAIEALIAEVDECFVLVGQGYECITEYSKSRGIRGLLHPRLVNFLDEAPTLEHLAALVLRSAGLISTPNGLSFLATVLGVPSLLCANSTLPGSIFEPWLAPDKKPPFDRNRIVGWNEGVPKLWHYWKDLFES
jgi:hypothetical protein